MSAKQASAWVKTGEGLMPCDPSAIDWFQSLGYGEVVTAVFTRMRSYKRMKKFHAMLKIGFDLFEPEPIEHPQGSGNFITPIKSADSWREHVTIRAGHYEIHGLPNGKVRIVAKSIAFESMEEEDFVALCGDVLTYILALPGKHISQIEYQAIMDELANFHF